MAVPFWSAVAENERSFKQWKGKAQARQSDIDAAIGFFMCQQGPYPNVILTMPSKAREHLRFVAQQKNYEKLKAVDSRLP